MNRPPDYRPLPSTFTVPLRRTRRRAWRRTVREAGRRQTVKQQVIRYRLAEWCGWEPRAS
jgi:hypothetical protein